ncbi:hypothetical protein C8J25_108151 [Sphingomonas faeni]|uniref:Uncharacterized protein n=1 Tax=Sphingomonas faeni TaxID=185950 RepID=A0A2T5U0R5_9SPHN|nr:hypothetical protein C8J25_108151 [Sphingomonas faeni]
MSASIPNAETRLARPIALLIGSRNRIAMNAPESGHAAAPKNVSAGFVNANKTGH